jgi:hypothetical protein
LLCGAVTSIAVTMQTFEEAALGHPYLEAIVIAILMGTAIRTIWEPGPRWRPGIAFSAKQLLEVAVAFLGASITFSAVTASGGVLIGAIVSIVAVTLAASFFISRALGLPNRLSLLIACGSTDATSVITSKTSSIIRKPASGGRPPMRASRVPLRSKLTILAGGCSRTAQGPSLLSEI